MSQRVSLKEAERKAFTTGFQDGLLDIFIGCILLVFAIAPFLSNRMGDFWSSAVFLPFWGLVWLAIWQVKRSVVEPRVGVVRFSVGRRIKLGRLQILLLGIGIGALILGVFPVEESNSVVNWPNSFIFAPMALVGFSVAAYFLGFRRLYVYGVLVASSPLIGELLDRYWNAPHHGFPITFGTTAAIIILVGLAILARLLRDSPTPTAGTTPEKVGNGRSIDFP